MIPSSFYETIHQACLPGIWSKAVSLSRTDAVTLISRSAEEISFRVRSQERPVSHKVSLWPEDEDWYCDCESRNEVCAHVAASIIFLKNSHEKQPFTESSSDTPSPSHSASPTPSRPPQRRLSTEIHYQFFRHQGFLGLERWVHYGPDHKALLEDSLTSLAGGILSGRIQAPPLSVTQEEYRVDAFLGLKKRALLSAETLLPLFKILCECTQIYYENLKITLVPHPYRLKYELTDEQQGFRLKLKKDEHISEAFLNGAYLCGTTLRALEPKSLPLLKKSFHSSDGLWFGPGEIPLLIKEVLPSLQAMAQVEILTSQLPELVTTSSEIVLVSSSEASSTLWITPELKKTLGPSHSPQGRPLLYVSDPFEEKALARKLQNELQLSLGQTTRFEGEAAVEFCLRLKNWKKEGKGYSQFQLHSDLEAQFDFQGNSFQLQFKTSSGEKGADPQSVLQAWRAHTRYVPLLQGGWGTLPEDWLNRYGERIEALIEIQNSQKKLPRYFLPELLQICENEHQAYPDSLAKLKETLRGLETLPQSILPQDLQAELRPYQSQGVNWLSFLRDAEMGAMLADDMGLGKTLQTLCSIQGRTLIIAPTSVIPSWQSQIEKFRPQLKVCTYYGTQRRWDESSDLVLTSYGLVRLEQDLFLHPTWDSIVVDEAQTLKNPESQISRVIHQLKGRFKIALSGTPIENQLEDLWSQFQYLNPGLLGSRDSFQESFVTPILKGNREVAEQLQQRIKPFILRRLKRDVIPELPPKTETVLYAQLSEEEQEVYQSLLSTTRKEVLTQLEQGGGIFGALELLLRLRQACCASSLVPGQKSAPSSKIELLAQTLEQSIAFGHRALIFSQWTSYLDLIEKELSARQIRFSRLDGSTRNRKEIVEEFQSSNGPSALLISLKAGGTGLTLTAADHVYIMDPWWNPAIENQAADRTHRIGQKNPVFIHRLIAQNTIEEKILALQKAKSQLSEQILEDSGVVATLSREDLLNLLS